MTGPALRYAGAAALCYGSAAFAQLPDPTPAPPLSLSGTFGLVSDYRFRGLSLSDRHPALQRSLTLAHRSGLYAGVWASSLDGFGEVGGANLEVDLMAGLRRPLAGGTADIGLLYYAYPGASGRDHEFFEPYAAFGRSYGPLNARLSAAFAPAQAATGSHSNLYLAADLALAVPKLPLTLKAHFGRSQGRTPLSPTGAYRDWQLGADFSWRRFAFGLSIVDTDLKRSELSLLGLDRRTAAPGALVSLSAGF